MATAIQIIKGPNRIGIATLRRKGIKYWWTLYRPTAIAVLHSGSAGAGSVVGGAIAGAVLLGGVGAIVGGIAGGSSGRVTFLVECKGRPTLTCRCKASEFAGVHAAISRMIARTQANASKKLVARAAEPSATISAEPQPAVAVEAKAVAEPRPPSRVTGVVLATLRVAAIGAAILVGAAFLIAILRLVVR